MSDAVHMADLVIKGRTRAIVCFGPANPMTGPRAGELFQVVIDPDFVSPSGEYIRFDLVRADAAQELCEIHGWQRIAALTICEVLAELGNDEKGQTVVMRSVTKEP